MGKDKGLVSGARFEAQARVSIILIRVLGLDRVF